MELRKVIAMTTTEPSAQLFDAATMRANLIKVDAEVHSVRNLYPLFGVYAGQQMTDIELAQAVLTVRANYLQKTGGRMDVNAIWFRTHAERFVRAMTNDTAVIDGTLALLRAGNYIG